VEEPIRFVLRDFIFRGIEHSGKYLSIKNCVLRIETGYAWDGASSIMPDIPSVMEASLIHDAGYQLMREGVLPQKARKAIDKIFYQICKDKGMNRVLALVAYKFVRAGAKKAGQPNVKVLQ
jgi:hypothetical protein